METSIQTYVNPLSDWGFKRLFGTEMNKDLLLELTYVNPLSDWGFKRLFGTEMNKDLLLEFLRGLFPERDIRDITYLKSERQNLTERERDSVFDVMCVSADGTQFVVEMQKRSQRYFRDRALYYAAIR